MRFMINSFFLSLIYSIWVRLMTSCSDETYSCSASIIARNFALTFAAVSLSASFLIACIKATGLIAATSN